MNAILSLVLLAAAPAQDEALKQDISKAVERLAKEGTLDSFAARIELEEIGRRAIPAIVAELNKRDAKPAVKRALAEALGRIREDDKEAVQALIAKLKDTDEYGESVAAAAARALGQIGDPSAAPALLEVLNSRAVDTDKILKVEVVKALGILRAQTAAEALRKALDDKKTATVSDNDDLAPLVAAAAADALGQLRSKEAVDDLGAKLADTTTNPASTQPLGVHAARALQRILAPELAGKTEKDEPRLGSLTGTQDEITKTLEAWKKWWDGLKGQKDVAAAKTLVGKVAAAVEAFKKDQGKYPEVLDYLKTAPTYAKNFPKDGYFQGELKDPWGFGLVYRTPGTGADFDVFSYGKDSRAWGKDEGADIYNHDKWVEVKRAETKKAIEETAKVIEQFKADQDRYPEKLVDLVAKPPYPVKKWEKAYLKEVPKDGFGVDLRFQIPSGIEGVPFNLYSLGADGAEGGEGASEDLWNHDKRPAKKDAAPKPEEKK